jgi:hypothetical protein
MRAIVLEKFGGLPSRPEASGLCRGSERHDHGELQRMSGSSPRMKLARGSFQRCTLVRLLKSGHFRRFCRILPTLPRSVPMTSTLSWRCRSNFRGSNLRLDRAECRRFWSNNQQGRCRRCAKCSRRCGRLGRRKVGAQCQQGSGQHRSDRGEVLQDQRWGVAPIVREWSSIPNEGGGDQSRRRRRNTRLGRHRDRPGGGSRGQDHDCGRSDDLEHEVHSLPPWDPPSATGKSASPIQGGYAWADSSDVTAVTLCLISARPALS